MEDSSSYSSASSLMSFHDSSDGGSSLDADSTAGFVSCERLWDSDRATEERRRLVAGLLARQNYYMLVLDCVYKECLCDTVVAQKLEPLRCGLLGHFEALWRFHSNVWTTRLAQRLVDWELDPRVCDLLVEEVGNFDVYHQLMDCLDEGVEFIATCCRQDESFQMRLDLVGMKVYELLAGDVGKAPIELPAEFSLRALLSYSLVGVEFVYRFLIEYETFIGPNQFEAAAFKKCIKFFERLAVKAGLVSSEQRQRSILTKLQGRLDTKIDLVAKNRRLVKKGPITMLLAKRHSTTRVYLVLLNDVVIICSEAEQQGKRYKAETELDTLGMSVNVDVFAFTVAPKLNPTSAALEPDTGFSIYVPCVRKVFQFFAKSEKDRINWLVAFQAVAQENCFESIQFEKIGKKTPVARNKELWNYCFKCHSRFGLLNRKQICKACGFVICRRCCQDAELEYDRSQKHRVCDYCHEYLSAVQNLS